MLWWLLGYYQEPDTEPAPRQVHLRHQLHRQIENSRDLSKLLKPILNRQDNIDYIKEEEEKKKQKEQNEKKEMELDILKDCVKEYVDVRNIKKRKQQMPQQRKNFAERLKEQRIKELHDKIVNI